MDVHHQQYAVHQPGEVILLLKASDAVAYDLQDAYAQCSDYTEGGDGDGDGDMGTGTVAAAVVVAAVVVFGDG